MILAMSQILKKEKVIKPKSENGMELYDAEDLAWKRCIEYVDMLDPDLEKVIFEANEKTPDLVDIRTDRNVSKIEVHLPRFESVIGNGNFSFEILLRYIEEYGGRIRLAGYMAFNNYRSVAYERTLIYNKPEKKAKGKF